MDTKQVVARFEAGRQALAMMDHSNIAKELVLSPPPERNNSSHGEPPRSRSVTGPDRHLQC
jgi:hypothetical protein